MPKKKKTIKETITIVIPKGAITSVELGLVHLTSVLSKRLGLSGGLGLGGENGYGAEYENDTFMMHPFCWCEQDDCKWCSGEAPNFLYKPTETKIWWYKWIGRDQKQKGNLPKDWLLQCIKTLNPPRKTAK